MYITSNTANVQQKINISKIWEMVFFTANGFTTTLMKYKTAILMCAIQIIVRYEEHRGKKHKCCTVEGTTQLWDLKTVKNTSQGEPKKLPLIP
jgi:hypothetical protein